jgi:hypothetical protein
MATPAQAVNSGCVNGVRRGPQYERLLQYAVGRRRQEVLHVLHHGEPGGHPAGVDDPVHRPVHLTTPDGDHHGQGLHGLLDHRRRAHDGRRLADEREHHAVHHAGDDDGHGRPPQEGVGAGGPGLGLEPVGPDEHGDDEDQRHEGERRDLR